MFGEGTLPAVSQAIIALALIGAATALGMVEPSVRPQLGGALMLGIGAATGFFFSQRSTVSAVHATTNGMSTMAGLISSAMPGPTGPMGPKGLPGSPQSTNVEAG